MSGGKKKQTQQATAAKKTPVTSPTAKTTTTKLETTATSRPTSATKATTTKPATTTTTPATAPATPATATVASTSTPAVASTTTPAKDNKKQQQGKQDKKTADGEEKKGVRLPSDTSSLRTPLTDTAAHILKGAIVSVLGTDASITKSVTWEKPNQAVLNIHWDGETIPQEQITLIQNRANEYIKQNLTVEHIEMDRKQAETKYTSEKVNNTYIYDEKQPPSSVTTVTLTHIAHCNINCCRGPHLQTTSDVKAIVLVKPKRRANGQKYEFTYICGDAAVSKVQSDTTVTSTDTTTPTTTKTKTNTNTNTKTSTSTSLINTSKKSHVELMLDEVIGTVLHTLQTNDVHVDAQKQKHVQESLRASLHRSLTMFGNASFANGYSSHITYNQKRDPMTLKSGPGL